MMTSLDMLWQTSFAVTGFAAVQALAYLYATVTSDIRKRMVPISKLLRLGIIIAHVLYIAAVTACWISILSTEILSTESSRIVTIATWVYAGQLILLLCVFALTYFATHTLTKEMPANTLNSNPDAR